MKKKITKHNAMSKAAGNVVVFFLNSCFSTQSTHIIYKQENNSHAKGLKTSRFYQVESKKYLVRKLERKHFRFILSSPLLSSDATDRFYYYTYVVFLICNTG